MTGSVPRPSRHEFDLADALPGATGRVTGIALDSRSVEPGDLYVAMPGLRTHGARHAAQAIERGAVAVLTDDEGAALLPGLAIPVLIRDDPRSIVGPLAAEIYGRPADRLQLFGVTGTNGKTSTVFLLQAALAALGRRVATIGTLGTRLGGEQVASAHGTITTPDGPDLQALLGFLAEKGVDAVAMEVSSIGLDQRRVEGLTFDAAAFTMFGQDHLEYHHTLEAYFSAKRSLFTAGRARAAVINVDDPWGRRLLAEVSADGHARALTTSSSGMPADYAVRSVASGPAGGSIVLADTPAGPVEFALSMLGSFNVANALTALGLVGATGGDVKLAASGLQDAYVPGRMQPVPLPEDAPHVVVDFAHTPEAVAAALAALPGGGRRIVVLGAGGDREVLKRPRMGAEAARHADVVVVTDDNPRSERPADIRAEVLAGARGAGGAATVLDGGDRRTAIERALGMARPGDWVAILGKGHEKTQEIAGEFTPFDDVAVVLDVLGGGRSAGGEA